MDTNNTDTVEINGQVYDAHSGTPVQATPAVQSTTPEQEVASTASPDQKHPINEAAPHAPKTSQLLMRSAVKKPDPSLKRTIKISESTDRDAASAPVAQPSSLVRLTVHNPERSQRAATVQRSDRISHLFLPPADNPAAQPVAQASPPPQPQVPNASPPQQAAPQATTPQQSPPKPKSAWKQAGWAAAPTVVVLAVLVFGSHAFTSVQLKIASAKAGFTTNLPTYHPAGFTLDQMNYNSGVFASDFYTQKGSQSYTITQKSTSWDTQDLLNNYVRLTTPNYKVVQLGSRTIYLYGNGNATWVSGNIWYQIDSDGSLSESQLIDVANSL